MIPPMVFVYAGYAAIFIMSIVLHEVAHGWVAYRCGDDTAYLMGRLSLNPIRHIDPFMTILLPALCLWMHMPMFGGAKPVPVNPYRFRRPVIDDRLVSAAGVTVNLVIAFVLSIVLRVLLRTGAFTEDSIGTAILGMGIGTNLLLFVFNLMPIPPLDGSRVLRTFLPWEIKNLFDKADRFGLFIVFLVIQIRPFSLAMWMAITFLWKYVLMLPGDLPGF